MEWNIETDTDAKHLITIERLLGCESGTPIPEGVVNLYLKTRLLYSRLGMNPESMKPGIFAVIVLMGLASEEMHERINDILLGEVDDDTDADGQPNPPAQKPKPVKVAVKKAATRTNTRKKKVKKKPGRKKKSKAVKVTHAPLPDDVEIFTPGQQVTVIHRNNRFPGQIATQIRPGMYNVTLTNGMTLRKKSADISSGAVRVPEVVASNPHAVNSEDI